MSIFEDFTQPCPSCERELTGDLVSSVNADRRADLKAAIIDGTFQSTTCPHCKVSFRIDPDLTYLEIGKQHWMVVRPAAEFPTWAALEAGARAIYDEIYGADAAPAAQAVGARIRPRLVFGWSGLREKLVAADAGLDDIGLELLKLLLIRGLDASLAGDDTELRLFTVTDDTLKFAVLDVETQRAREVLDIPRALYDDVAADTAGWAAQRLAFDGAYFVDTARLLVKD